MSRPFITEALRRFFAQQLPADKFDDWNKRYGVVHPQADHDWSRWHQFVHDLLTDAGFGVLSYATTDAQRNLASNVAALALAINKNEDGAYTKLDAAEDEAYRTHEGFYGNNGEPKSEHGDPDYIAAGVIADFAELLSDSGTEQHAISGLYGLASAAKAKAAGSQAAYDEAIVKMAEKFLEVLAPKS